MKPLYYGAFGSYAPSYDSTFANLTKEESELVFQTYGDETAVQYAERQVFLYTHTYDKHIILTSSVLGIIHFKNCAFPISKSCMW